MSHVNMNVVSFYMHTQNVHGYNVIHVIVYNIIGVGRYILKVGG